MYRGITSESITMRQDHISVFLDVANNAQCWIGLREPNPLSDKWVGKAGYRPKGEKCKAKTADNPMFDFAGLVVDPTARPEAFKKESLRAATDTWKQKFILANGKLPPGFSLAKAAQHRGLVQHSGLFVYADYDLMAIQRSNPKGEWLPTAQKDVRDLFAKVKPALNKGLHAPLIQHGAEFMWDQGVGAREQEWVLWFGPGKRVNRWPSSMPHGGH
jgi:hypothetical protein